MKEKLNFRDIFHLSPNFDERTEKELNSIFNEIDLESFSRIYDAVLLDWEYTIEHIDDKFDFIDSFYHNFLCELLFVIYGFIEGDNIEDIYEFFDKSVVSVNIKKNGEYYFFAEKDFDGKFLSQFKNALEEKKGEMFDRQISMCNFFIKKFQ